MTMSLQGVGPISGLGTGRGMFGLFNCFVIIILIFFMLISQGLVLSSGTDLEFKGGVSGLKCVFCLGNNI